MNGLSTKPAADETLMTRPLPRLRMCGRTAFVMRMRPKTLTSNTFWVWASENSSAAPIPALLTSTSSRPKRSSTRSTTLATDSSLVTSRSRYVTPLSGAVREVSRFVPTTVKPASARVRYGKEHRLATRQRIIETASRRFKRDGIDGSGVATLMKDAGLTNGAFYAHFESKEDLVATAVSAQLRDQREWLTSFPPGRDGIEQMVRTYLSPEHRDNPEEGCPSAALLDEIGRCTDPTKEAYTGNVLAIIDDIAARWVPQDPQSARTKT